MLDWTDLVWVFIDVSEAMGADMTERAREMGRMIDVKRMFRKESRERKDKLVEEIKAK